MCMYIYIYIYTPIYTRRLHHFQSNTDFPKVSKVSNLNKPVKKWDYNVTDTDKIQNSKS